MTDKYYDMNRRLWMVLDKIYDPEDIRTSQFIEDALLRDFGIEVIAENFYRYIIRDNLKFTMFILKYSHVK